MRLDKYLADMGCGSRSELKKAIRQGAVKIDGKIQKDPGFAVTDTMQVSWHDKLICYEEYVYYMLHKPAGIITATEDARQKTVLDLLPADHRKGLAPAGRLDKDTEGLLLITNDGELSHRLLSPRHHVDKVYFARIDGRVTKEDVSAFAKGLVVDRELTALPAELKILTSDRISEIEITIREGKFHQIKRMFHVVGKEVLYLKRLSFGSLQLDPTLAPGEFRRLTEQEVQELKKL